MEFDSVSLERQILQTLVWLSHKWNKMTPKARLHLLFYNQCSGCTKYKITNTFYNQIQLLSDGELKLNQCRSYPYIINTHTYYTYIYDIYISQTTTVCFSSHLDRCIQKCNPSVIYLKALDFIPFSDTYLPSSFVVVQVHC